MALAFKPPIEDPARLAALDRYEILDTQPEPAYDDLVELAKQICDTPVALISLVTAERQWFKARSGFEPCETTLDQSVCSHALVSREMLIIPDLTQDERTRDNPLVTGEPYIRFYAGALLETKEKQILGTLCVIDATPRPGGLTVSQSSALAALARQVVDQLELRRALIAHEANSDRLRKSEERLELALNAGEGVGTWDWDIAHDHLVADGRFAKLFGIDPAIAAAGGRSDRFFAVVHPTDLPRLEMAIADALATGNRFSEEFRVVLPSGAIRWIGAQGQCALTDAGTPIRFPGVVYDISKRMQVSNRQDAILRLGDALRNDRVTRAGVIEAATRILGETLGASRAGYAAVDIYNGVLSVEGNWVAPGVASRVGQHRTEDFRASVDRLRKGETLAVSNTLSANWLGADIASYDALGVKALIQVPSMKADRLAGILFVHSGVQRTWTNEELDFAYAISDRMYAVLAKLEAEAEQRLLNDELGHRLKNMFAMVLAIASQTLRKVTEQDAVKAFNQRVMALSTAHDVLLQDNWSSAQIVPTLEGVLSLHGGTSRFAIDGPPVTLGPKAVLSISLLVHELATNAAKYGALSVPSGTVHIGWDIAAGSVPIFNLSWQERDGPPVSQPQRRGVGSRLIGLGLVGTGRAELRYDPAGFEAVFSAPLALMIEN